MHVSGNSSTDTSLIRDIYCSPEVLFETYVAMKFVDDDDDYIIIAGLSPHVVSAMHVSSFIQTASLMRVVVMHAVRTHTAVHVGRAHHRQPCQSSFNQSAVFLQHRIKIYEHISV